MATDVTVALLVREVEVAWLAGLWEGEGYLSPHSNTPKRAKRPYIYWRFGIAMTDHDVIERAHRIGGVGVISGPYKAPGTPAHYKPVSRWAVNNQEEVEAMVALLFPYMSERRRRQVELFRARTLARL